MKYRVIKSFLDNTTRKPYNEDYIYETDDIECAKELASGGYIIMPESEETKPENKGETEKSVSESDTAQTEAENGDAKKKTVKK